MPYELTVRVHSIAEDGIPDNNDEKLSGRTAFIFDGCIVTGWPLRVDSQDCSTPYSGYWEANTDVGDDRKFVGVTHWIEFPVPVREIEKP